MLVRIILFLFVCSVSTFASSDIKFQTHLHLAVMGNVVAVEQVGKQSYPIAVFGGRLRAQRPTPRGLYVDQAWYSVLNDSVRWQWAPDGDRFIYRDMCGWIEDFKSRMVPCEGSIYVDGDDVRRITQLLRTGGKYGDVTLDIAYGWVQLRHPRLLPLSLTLASKFETRSVRWTDYREFSVESEAIAIDGDDGFVAPVAKIKSAGLPVPVSPAENVPEPILRRLDLAPVGTESAMVKVKRRPWWKFLLR